MGNENLTWRITEPAEFKEQSNCKNQLKNLSKFQYCLLERVFYSSDAFELLIYLDSHFAIFESASNYPG